MAQFLYSLTTEPGTFRLLLFTPVPAFITHVQMYTNLTPVIKDKEPKEIKGIKVARGETHLLLLHMMAGLAMSLHVAFCLLLIHIYHNANASKLQNPILDKPFSSDL